MADDRKQHKRHPPEVLRVRFEHPSGGERAEAIAWDASLGGLFLETKMVLEEGALVALEIETATSKVSVDARVLWKRDEAQDENHPSGMAVRFLDLTDEVKIALTNAILGKEERTILGVGGATIESTTPGIKPDAGPTPRETQIGVAPPANAPNTATPEPSVSIALDLVTKKQSEPKVAVAPPPAPPPEPKREDDTKKRVTRAVVEEEEERPRRKSGASGTLILALVLAAVGGAAYYYRDEIAKSIAPEPPPTTSAPEPVASSAAEAPSMMPSAEPVATASTELEAGVKEAGAADAGIKDAGHDSGHDAGSRDAGTRVQDAGTRVHDAGKPAPKHSGGH